MIVLLRQGWNYLGAEGGHAPPPPPLKIPFGKKSPNLYITTKNLLFALKLIYLPPFPPKKFTSWPIKFQKWKIYPIIHCLVVPRISRKTFNQNIWTIYKYRQQEKSRKQITYPDNKKIFGDGLSKNN